MKVKGFLFDYGGTLDTAGCHWGKMLWHAYQRQFVPIEEEQFRDAYVFAERTSGKIPSSSQTIPFIRHWKPNCV